RYLALLAALLSPFILLAEDKPAAAPLSATKEIKADAKDSTAAPVLVKPDVKKAAEASFNIGGMNLTLQDAINMVLEKNLTLQAAKYDVVMSDTAARKLEKKYAPTIGLETRHLDFS